MPPVVLRELYKAGVGGLTAYAVRGMSGETSTFLHSKRPFQLNSLPASVKLEVVCTEESFDKIVRFVAQAARTGNRGDSIIAVREGEKVLRIRDMEPLSR